MQQTTKTNNVNEEQNAHTPDSPSPEPTAESKTAALLEELDPDEILDAYRAQQALESDASFSDPSRTRNEPAVKDYQATENVYSEEDDADELDNLSEEQDETVPISLTNKRILLIEDDDDTTEILKQNLLTLGITKVNVATNAEGALSLLATDKEMFPDIVILELALIGMDGIQFLAQLRAHKSKKLQNLPAVVITMLDSPSIFRRAARQKVGAFLRKPVSTEGLKKGIESALRGDVVEQPFSQPKSWLDDVDEQELKEKRKLIKAKAAAKAEKKGFWVWLLNTLVPWSGRI